MTAEQTGAPTSSAPITFRRGAPNDSLACHTVMWQAITDLARRRQLTLEGTAEDWWAGSEAEFTYLASAAAEWWVAEDSASGAIVGYARSIRRGGLSELTEFFVRPNEQSRGIGRTLLSRAFPRTRGVRSIIATTDVRALGRYYTADTVAQFPLLTITGAPAAAGAPDPLEIVQLDVTDNEHLVAFERVERATLGYSRGTEELRWILEHRDGYLYRRDAEVVGFAFVGKEGAGPIGALDAHEHLKAVLRHVEQRAHALGLERLSLQVPGLNSVTVRHLRERGFHIDPWVNLLMSNRPFGHFDRFLPFSPLFL
jgi:GNAT superfamily N-acetyltransferase